MPKEEPFAWPQTEPADLLSPEEQQRLKSELREGLMDQKLFADGYRRLKRHIAARYVAYECAGYQINAGERLLRTMGTPEEIEEVIHHALAVSEYLIRLEESPFLEDAEDWDIPEIRPGSVQDEYRQIRRQFDRYLSFLRTGKDLAARAVAQLNDLGWQFDPESGHVKETGVPRRPKHSLTEAVERLCEHWKIDSNVQPTRDSIALAFRGLYPSEQLDAAPRGPIGNAVNSYLRRLTRHELQARKAAATSKAGSEHGRPES